MNTFEQIPPSERWKVDDIFKKIALYKYINMANKGNRWKKELVKISIWLSNEERNKRIDTEYPYLKTKQKYIEYLKEYWYPKIGLERYVETIRNKMFSLFVNENSFSRFLSENNIEISKEERISIKQYFIRAISSDLTNLLSEWTNTNKKLFNSITKLSMTVQTTLISCIKWITDESTSKETKQLLWEWISDPEIERTVPNAERKMKQTIETLNTEHIVCFCCPDYPGGFIEWTSIWKYDMESGEIGDSIWFFGGKVFQILSEFWRDLKNTYNKLKTIDIIMPSYQFFQSPKLSSYKNRNEKYDEFVKKITMTGNKLKDKIDQYFIENNISWVTINVKLSSEVYKDQDIIDLKAELQDTVSSTIRSSEILKKENKKLLKYEEATGNVDPSDELASYLAEWYLLEKFYSSKTLLLVPESPQMPKLIVELQEILSTKEKIVWLPTLIIQKDRRFDVL